MSIIVRYINRDVNEYDEYDAFDKISNNNLVCNIEWDDRRLYSLPDNMNFPNLRFFSCQGTNLRSLYDNLNFPNLKTLWCSYNDLTALPDNMNFPNLEALGCSNNDLTSLPACILNFKNLKCFHHHCNKYTNLSSQMEQFIDIKKDQGYIKRDLCFTEDLNVIKLLLEEGIDIDGLCICGHTAIHYHTIENNFDIVKYLLSKGADVNKKNIYGDGINKDALAWGTS